MVMKSGRGLSAKTISDREKGSSGFSGLDFGLEIVFYYDNVKVIS